MTAERCNKFRGHPHRCRNVAADNADHFQNVTFDGRTAAPCGKKISQPLSKRFPGLYATRLRVYTPAGAMLEFEVGLREEFGKKLLKQFANAVSGRDPETGEMIPSGDAAVDSNNEGRAYDCDSYGRIYYLCPGLDDEGDSAAAPGSEERSAGDHETRWPCLKEQANLISSRGVDGLHRPVFDIDNGAFTTREDTVRGLLILDRGSEVDTLKWLEVRRAFIEADLASDNYGGIDCIMLSKEAYTVESSTPGHFHLLIGHTTTWERYLVILQAMLAAGIVQRGYVDHAIHRGAAFVRTPWSKKIKPFRIKK